MTVAAQPSAGPLIRIENVSRNFLVGGEVIHALDDVSLTIERGEFVAIMGQSGSGKSTLMNIIGCLDRPNEGSYVIGGERVDSLGKDDLARVRREVFGFVFQRYNLLPSISAAANVEIPAVYAGLPHQERRTRALELLARLGLSSRSDHLPTQLSGGQQQRVSIARALMNNPQMILADEPTGALDSKSGEEVLSLLEELNRNGTAIVLVTHDEGVASRANRIIRIKDGKIVEDRRRESSPPRTAPTPTHIEQPGLTLAATISESTRMAIDSLRMHIVRTVITLMGIVIGVAAVVIMLAVGNGSKEKVLQQISSLGTNLLLVRPGAPGIRGGGDIATLTLSDSQVVKSMDGIDGVVPERSARLTARFGNLDYSTLVQGVSEELPRVRNWPVESGAFFTDRDLTSYAPVAVIGQTVLKNLFADGESPIGQYILLRNVPFEIVGIMGTRGASPGGTDQDDVVLVPVTTGLVRLFGRNYLSSLTISVGDTKRIAEIEEAVRVKLLNRHRTEDFRIRNMASIVEMASETQNTLTILLGAVAAISLIVGGIGVMNIMLVSVVERTREIGVRVATGARTRDIMFQFNIESAVVCAIGGAIGLLLGFGAGAALTLFGIDVLFTVWPATLAFTSAFVTGLVFGYLPAKKAADLDPVVALAAE